jgi:hypothetical protein
MEYSVVENALKELGYTNLKKVSGTRIAILTNDNRVDVLEYVTKKIQGSVYDRTPSSSSSVGVVNYGKIYIMAKPASKQGTASAGVDNEHILVNTINKHAKNGPINVKFKGKNKDYDVVGCVKAEAVGGDTAGRKKADIVVIDTNGVKYPISIKKDNAEVWESADSYYGPTANKIIDDLIKKGKVAVLDQGGFYKIEPNIAVKATSSETKSVVFGSDIERDGGCIVTKTFSSSSFKMDGDILVVDCSNIITQMSDVKGDKEVYFLIRNDKTRKSLKYKGLRVLAIYKKRLNKNILII